MLREKDRWLTADRLRRVLEYDPITGIFRWRVSTRNILIGTIAGHLKPNGYIAICIEGRAFIAHRLAWLYVHGVWPDQILDHKNTIKSDNRIANLRLATFSQNNANRGAQNGRPFKGITAHRGKWRALIQINGKQRSLGIFHTPEDAHLAYAAKARELFGPFARTA